MLSGFLPKQKQVCFKGLKSSGATWEWVNVNLWNHWNGGKHIHFTSICNFGAMSAPAILVEKPEVSRLKPIPSDRQAFGARHLRLCLQRSGALDFSVLFSSTSALLGCLVECWDDSGSAEHTRIFPGLAMSGPISHSNLQCWPTCWLWMSWILSFFLRIFRIGGEIGMLHTSSPSVVPGRRLRLTWPGQLLRCQHGTGCPRALLEGAWHWVLHFWGPSPPSPPSWFTSCRRKLLDFS